jgi:hypothetical protein
MKKTAFYLTAICLTATCCVSQRSFSQNLCKIDFSKGQILHYTRTDSPDPIFEIPNYPILKGKKKQDAYDQFKADVASGKIKGKTVTFDMSISNVTKKTNGSITEFEFDAGSAKYYSYAACTKDTLYGIKNKHGVPLPGSNNDTVGFMIMGITQYPLNMKVGDVLPASTDLFYTFPKNYDMSYKKMILDKVISTTNTWEDRDYIYTQTSTQSYFKEVVMNLTYTLQFSAPTVTYRHVIAEDEVIVGGKTYKALKIELSLETKVEDIITNVNADELLVKWAYQFTNKFIVNKVNKSEHLKNGGFEWFVPELGIITTTEIFNNTGDPLYKTHITSIQ